MDPARPGTVHVAIDALAYGARPVGVGRYIDNLLRGLAETGGLEVSVAARAGARHALARLGHDTFGPGAAGSQAPLRLLWEQFRLPGHAERRGAQLLHGLMGVVPLRCSLPSVVTIHDVTFLSHPHLHTRSKVRYFGHMLPRAARAARYVITDSAASRDEIVRHLPIDARRVRVVPLSVDPSFVPADTAAVAATRARFRLDLPYVLYAGVLEPRKNLVRLIDAVCRLRADGYPVELVLAGKIGWRAEPVLASIAAAGAAVRHLGYVSDDDLRALLTGASAFAYVPEIEGFGLPVAEALACGAPVVTSSVSSLPEVAGDAAELVDPTAVAAIAGGIARLLDNAELRERRRLAGLERTAAMSLRRLAESTAAVYREALAG